MNDEAVAPGGYVNNYDDVDNLLDNDPLMNVGLDEHETDDDNMGNEVEETGVAATAAPAAADPDQEAVEAPLPVAVAPITGDLPIPEDLPAPVQALEAMLSMGMTAGGGTVVGLADIDSYYETRDASYLARLETAFQRGEIPLLYKLISRPPSVYHKWTVSGGYTADVKPYGYDAIRQRLHTNPEEARWRDWQSPGCFQDFHPTILHGMVADHLSPIPLDVLRTMVELDPDAITTPSLNGRNSSILDLLLVLRRDWYSPQHMEILVEACPRAVLMQNSIRQMPIHTVLMTCTMADDDALDDVVKYVNIFFKANPSCFMARNYMDDTPLRIAAAAWAGFYRLSVGDQVRVMGMEPGPDDLVNGSVGEVVEILQNSFDNPMLSEKYVVELNGQNCTMGRVNLQAKKGGPSWELLLKILELTYHARGGSCERFGPLRAILLLSPFLVSCPPSLPEYEGDSSIGLYFRSKGGASHRDNIITYFMNMYPEQLSQKNADGTSLLHTVLGGGNELPWHRSLAPILDAIPEALLLSDPKTGLYPAMMAAIGDSFSVDTVYRLLRLDPSLCALGLNSGHANDCE